MKYRAYHTVLLLALLASCSVWQDTDDAGDGIQSVRLSLSVGSGAATKADVDLLTELDVEPVFRGITDLCLVPFSSSEAVSSDPSLTGIIRLPGIVSGAGSDDSGSVLYASTGVYIPKKCSDVLLYGRAVNADGAQIDATVLKQINGSVLRSGGFQTVTKLSAAELGFAPDVMMKGDDVPEPAQKIAGVLNGIMLGAPTEVEAFYGAGLSTTVSLNWNESVGDSNLREAYRQITNDGAMIPGSAPLVESLLSSLYGMLRNYESHNVNEYEVVEAGVAYEARKADGTLLLYKDLYNQLKEDVLGRFAALKADGLLEIEDDALEVYFADQAVRSYPENLGLPSGCAVLRWTPAGFVVPLMNGVEGMAPMNRYCFPPSLCYYINSGIRTSEDEDVLQSFIGSSSVNWSDILSRFTQGTTVSSKTKAVALVEPVQFSVGLIRATIKAGKAKLQDNDGLPETTVDAIGENLPVTGIILGGQYAQTYDFTPVFSEDGEYYLYDNQIPGVYLTADTSAPIRSLSFQTPADREVYFTLEFRNDSGKTFYGADGRILPGRKFYMVGKLTLPEPPRAFDSVVVKDHVTTVTCVINSLDGAYNAVPDLGLPQLVVGVQAQMNWLLSSPTTIMLE